MSDLLQGLNQANGVNGWQSYNRKISLNSFIQRLFALDYEAYVLTDSSINIFTSPCTWIIWLMGVFFAVPPLIGFGDYKLESSKIW